MFKNCHICFYFGVPMAGKGLLGKVLHRIHGVQPLIASDMIRAKRNRFPIFDAKARVLQEKGQLLDDRIMAALLRENFRPANGGTYGFDGIPRNVEQAKDTIKLIRLYGINRLSLFNLEMTDEESINRFHRKAYSKDRQGRDDVDPDVHKNRLKIHRENDGAILDYLQSQGVNICEIQATDNMSTKVRQVERFLNLKPASETHLNTVIETLLEEVSGETIQVCA